MLETYLITERYQPDCPVRRREIQECLTSNYSINFDRIIEYSEDSTLGEMSPGVIRLSLQRRLRFSDFLDFINNNKNKIGLAVLSNSDIFLDSSILSRCLDIPAKVLLAITRYESDNSLAKDPWCTQDTWVMRFQPIHRSARAATHFCLGIPGCELRFAEALYATGFDVYNPCLSIVNRHNHRIPTPHDSEQRLFGTYVFTAPCFIEQVLSRDESSAGKLVYLRDRL